MTLLEPKSVNFNISGKPGLKRKFQARQKHYMKTHQGGWNGFISFLISLYDVATGFKEGEKE